MNDLSNQIDELKNEINSTQEIIQKSSNEEGNFTIFRDVENKKIK